MTLRFFDNRQKTVNLKDVEQFRVSLSKENLQKLKSDVSSMTLSEVKEYVKNTQYIFLKPVKISSTPLKFSILVSETKKSFIDIYETLLYSQKFYLIVPWSLATLLIFGFWDTFASTFLIEFLNQVKPGWSYILLALIAIPAF